MTGVVGVPDRNTSTGRIVIRIGAPPVPFLGDLPPGVPAAVR